jgi:hypothetical protein
MTEILLESISILRILFRWTCILKKRTTHLTLTRPDIPAAIAHSKAAPAKPFPEPEVENFDSTFVVNVLRQWERPVITMIY